MLHKSSGTNLYPLNTYLHVCLVACKLTHEVFVKWKFRTYSSFSQFIPRLAQMALLASKDLTTAKKVTSSGAQPDVRDYNCLRVQCLTN